jgi:hypothetical protein
MRVLTFYPESDRESQTRLMALRQGLEGLHHQYCRI